MRGSAAFTTYRVRRPTSRALFGTIAGYVPGFILPFAIAAHMTVGHLTDTYSFALGVAVFASGLFVGVLQTNILPLLQVDKRGGRGPFTRRLRSVGAQAMAVAAVLYVAIGGIAVLFVGREPHWTHEQRALMLAATAVLGAFVLLSAINAMLAAALNALNRFFTPAATQCLRALATLAVVPIASRDVSGFVLLAVLMAVGEGLRTGCLGAQLLVATKSLPTDSRASSAAVDVSFWRIAAPSAISLAIAAASPLVDRAVATRLRPGSVTVLDLGERVFQVPLTVLAMSIVLVAGTHWAELGTANLPELRAHARRTAIRGTIVSLFLFLAGAMCVGIGAFFVGPQFAGTSTARLVIVILFLLAGLPGAFLISAGSRLLTATRTTYLLPAFAVCSFGTNLAFDVVGARALGVVGIALSSTIYRSVNAVLYLWVADRLMKSEFRGLTIRHRRAATIMKGS